MFRVEVDGPIVCRSGLETADENVGVVIFGVAVRSDCGRRIGAQIEAADRLRGASRSITITEVNRITRVKLVVALDCVLDSSVINACDYVSVGESDRVVRVPRVTEKKSLKSAVPLISNVSTLVVFEIRSLSVTRKVRPKSPSQFGRSVLPVRLY